MPERSEVPEGWVSLTIQDVCDINPPKPKKGDIPDETPVTFVPMPAVDAERGEISSPEIRPFSEVRSGFTAFRDGDVIMAKITPCMENGKAAIAGGLVSGLGFGSTEFFVLRSNDSILPQYLFHYIRQVSFRELAESNMTGSVGQKRVPKEFIVNAAIPLPPLAEQHRIVAAIEALFARLDAANARLERVPGILKQFRQAVLAAACDGRLTEDWRQTNVVFECEADYLAASRAVLNNEELSPAFSHTVQKDLPSMWKHVTFGSLGDWKSGATPSKSNPNFWISGQIPWVSPKDMKTEAITDSIDHITTEAVEKTNLHILPKDSLIFVVRGMILARDFPVALTEHEVTINQDMRALIPSGCVYPRYLLQALQNQAHHILRAVRSSTHGTKRLESPTLKTWPIALPPLPEQNEIVRRVDALFALADKIEAEVAAAHAKTETMRQSILAQAFSGRLVPTEAELAQREGREYEPASVLLERIHSEKKEKTGRRGIQSTLV